MIQIISFINAAILAGNSVFVADTKINQDNDYISL